MDIFDKLRESDLQGDMKIINDVCGLESTKLMLRYLGGVQLYVPRLTRFDKFINEYVEKNNEKSINEIATELNVSSMHIRNVIKRSKESNRKEKKSNRN